MRILFYIFVQRYVSYVFLYVMTIIINGVLLFHWLSILNHKKFIRLTMGFVYFMYFHSLVPVIDLWFRVVTKLVSEQWFHCWSWNCRFVFSYTTAVIGCQMSVLSSLLPVFCVVFDFVVVCLTLFVLSSLNEKESTRCSCCWSS